MKPRCAHLLELLLGECGIAQHGQRAEPAADERIAEVLPVVRGDVLPGLDLEQGALQRHVQLFV